MSETTVADAKQCLLNQMATAHPDHLETLATAYLRLCEAEECMVRKAQMEAKK